MSGSATIKSLLTLGHQQLHQSDEAALEAELLLSHCLQKSRSYLHTWPEQTIDENFRQQFDQLLQRRASGEPIAYILGTQGFWTLELQVNRHVLIPRPETELLVEQALQHIPAHSTAHIADLGTGSGAIALAIASERAQCSVVAVDCSEKALAVAAENARCLNLPNVTCKRSHWFAELGNMQFDLIVSNPPYVAQEDPHLQQGDLRFEPSVALGSGKDGLDDIRIIIAQAKNYLHRNAWLILEHGFDQADAIASLFRQNGYDNVKQLRDLNQLDRVSMARWPGTTGEQPT